MLLFITMLRLFWILKPFSKQHCLEIKNKPPTRVELIPHILESLSDMDNTSLICLSRPPHHQINKWSSNLVMYQTFFFIWFTLCYIAPFTNKYVFTQPLHQWKDVTQGQFLRGICIFPTPPPMEGCDTRLLFKRSMYLPLP